jgi:hypothetical protein
LCEDTYDISFLGDSRFFEAFHEKVGRCQAQCTVQGPVVMRPRLPSPLPLFSVRRRKSPPYGTGVFSAPFKMQAMGPLRSLCQTLFVWRCDRGPQPATRLSAPVVFCRERLVLPGACFLFLLWPGKHFRNFKAVGFIPIRSLLHATDCCPASIRTLEWAAFGPVPVGVRQNWCCHLRVGFRSPCLASKRSHQNSAVDESCHPFMNLLAVSAPW